MCPEMNDRSDPPKGKKKIHVCIIGAVLLGVFAFAVWFICSNLMSVRIPELKALEQQEDNRIYFVNLYSYDGEVLTNYSNTSFLGEGREKIEETAHRFLSLKGRKTNSWTPDKITYPVYALDISSNSMEDDEKDRETVVWSNGYLFTSSGDVYLCSPDFSPFMEEMGDFTVRETEIKDISYSKAFRPMYHAYSKWHPELLHESTVSDDVIVDGIEAEVTGVRIVDGCPVATVEIRNNSEKEWHYCDSSIFAGVDLTLDGKHYAVYHDPDIIDTYAATPDYNNSVKPGEKAVIDLGLWLYGKLPKGDYRIIISNRERGEFNYVCADYRVEK